MEHVRRAGNRRSGVLRSPLRLTFWKLRIHNVVNEISRVQLDAPKSQPRRSKTLSYMLTFKTYYAVPLFWGGKNVITTKAYINGSR